MRSSYRDISSPVVGPAEAQRQRPIGSGLHTVSHQAAPNAAGFLGIETSVSLGDIAAVLASAGTTFMAWRASRKLDENNKREFEEHDERTKGVSACLKFYDPPSGRVMHFTIGNIPYEQFLNVPASNIKKASKGDGHGRLLELDMRTRKSVRGTVLNAISQHFATSFAHAQGSVARGEQVKWMDWVGGLSSEGEANFKRVRVNFFPSELLQDIRSERAKFKSDEEFIEAVKAGQTKFNFENDRSQDWLSIAQGLEYIRAQDEAQQHKDDKDFQPKVFTMRLPATINL